MELQNVQRLFPADDDHDRVAGQRPGAPRHVAIIMDGNGRWAKKRFLPRSAGHRQGLQAARDTVRAALELGVEVLTLFSFSAENWVRPASEVKFLMSLLRRFVRQDVAKFHGLGIRIRLIGERADLPKDIIALFDESERLTQGNTAMTLLIAFNYGSRQELTKVMRELGHEVATGGLAPDDITPDMITRRLYTADIPEPDLLIRTSGEKRLSNFLLWQCAYSEFVFMEDHWPAFNKETLERAIVEYIARDRRYGGLKDK